MSCRDRPQVWNASTAKFTLKLSTPDIARQDCMARGGDYYYGLGKTDASIGGVFSCYEPCPDASCNGYDANGNATKECNPRPLLTAVDIYYEVMKDATKSCMDKSEAYKRAVEEGGGDPSRIGFTSDCPNPYTPAIPPNTDPTAGGVFDPASSNGDPTKPLDVPPFDPTVPYIPPAPPTYRDFDGIASDTSPANPDLPTSRITLTDEEIDMFPKVNDYGTMREDTLAQRCRVNPTFIDVNTEHLNDCLTYIKDFTWCCIPTQVEFDKLTDDLQCLLSQEYRTLYDKPERIKEMRNFAPSITITRDAPPVDVPVYNNTPEERKRRECNGKKNEDGVDCVYSGGCRGSCVCPEPRCKHVDMGYSHDGRSFSYQDCGGKITYDDLNQAEYFDDLGRRVENGGGFGGDSSWFSLDNILLIGAGVGVFGVLGYGYYVYSKASMTASAVGNFGTSMSSVGMGGFKLVPT